jgi:hypothetical protein
MITRRRFAFWLSFGLFSLAERLHIYGLDELAAATLRRGEPAPKQPTATLDPAVHWRAAENEAWRWFERETYLNGKWTLSGITTPINTTTGLPLADRLGYLDESLVPPEVRFGLAEELSDEESEAIAEIAAKYADRRPAEKRRSRHGRPPSKWLRSLHADELRIWLKTIKVPEAGVSGMTYWEHLTRDHSFLAANIEGLSIDEQAKLHAAAHFGY